MIFYSVIKCVLKKMVTKIHKKWFFFSNCEYYIGHFFHSFPGFFNSSKAFHSRCNLRYTKYLYISIFPKIATVLPYNQVYFFLILGKNFKNNDRFDRRNLWEKKGGGVDFQISNFPESATIVGTVHFFDSFPIILKPFENVP